MEHKSFLIEFHTSTAPWDPPWVTWGPYLKKGSVKYYPNVFFWTSWAPWVSPYPHMLCNRPKNLKFFQGAVTHNTSSLILLLWFLVKVEKVNLTLSFFVSVIQLYWFSLCLPLFTSCFLITHNLSCCSELLFAMTSDKILKMLTILPITCFV